MSDYGRLQEENAALKAEVERLQLEIVQLRAPNPVSHPETHNAAPEGNEHSD